MFKIFTFVDDKNLKTINIMLIGSFVTYIILSLFLKPDFNTTSPSVYVENRYSIFASNIHSVDHNQSISYNPVEVFSLQSER